MLDSFDSLYEHLKLDLTTSLAGSVDIKS
jgi:hypothetical protein